MIEESDATEEGGACVIDDEGRASLRRLSELSQRLNDMIQSGELMADLYRIALLNPVRHGDRRLLARDADVVAKIATRACAPMPITKLHARDVACLPHLERAGFLTVEDRAVRATPRGLSLNEKRQRARVASRMRLMHLAGRLATAGA